MRTFPNSALSSLARQGHGTSQDGLCPVATRMPHASAPRTSTLFFSFPILARWMKRRASSLTARSKHASIAEGLSERRAREGYKASGALEGLEAGCRSPWFKRSFIVIAALAAMTAGAAPALASNAEPCPNEQLRAENNSTSLPDCRAYEQVTPVEKGAQHFIPGGFPSPNGSAYIFSSLANLPLSPVGGTDSYVARRTPRGWTTQALAPLYDNPEDMHVGPAGAVGEGFETVFIDDDDDLVGEDHDENVLDLFAVNEAGAITWVSQGTNGGVGVLPPAGTEPAEILGGASPELANVIFEVPDDLSLLGTDSHAAGNEIYNRATESTTELVGLLPSDNVPECGAELGDQDGSEAGDYRSVSESGTTTFFTSPYQGTSCVATIPRQLYARVGGETLEVSATEAGVTDPHGTQEANYDLATPSASDVLFTSKGALTANADTDGDGTEDLYECAVTTVSGRAACQLTDLSSAGLRDGSGSQVQGVLGMSNEGGIVYFVALGRLTSEAHEGADNLYVWEHGQLEYITTLSSSDSSDWSGLIQGRNSQVTPDGQHVLFMSVESLTDYSNGGRSEIYLHTLGNPSLTCVSCGPEGTTASGSVTLNRGAVQQFAPYDNLSANGSEVFFESTEPLTGKNFSGETAVYEWRGGKLSVIAAGGATFAGATPSGSDVFFGTRESLVPEDIDGGDQDIYDARVDGGFPAPPTREKQCESNETCRGGGTSLSTLTPASLTQTGTGNYIPPPPVVAPGAKSKLKKSLTRAQKLTKALKACRKQAKHRRAGCEKRARKQYVVNTNAKGKKKHAGGKKHG